MWEAFFKVHRDLPREGPGSDDATREALRRLPPLPSTPRVLDLGCGPGRQTLVLARELKAPIVAVDFHKPFLAQLRKSAEAEGLSDHIITHHGRMEDLDEQSGSVDLIWCEGAIYLLGFGEGLRLFKPWLRKNGLVVASEVSRLVPHLPAEAQSFWDAEYPPLTDIDGNISLAADAGFDVFDHFVLPQKAWWDEYYTPIEARVADLRPEAAEDPVLATVLDQNEREIAICRRYGDAVGLVFYLMRAQA
jgi:serine/threonine-protein kinase HipA